MRVNNKKRKVISEDKNDLFVSQRLEPRTKNQKNYIEAVKRSIITIVHGESGVGKTHLACGLAAKALQTKEVKKIILVRPVVECGPSMGFLPGEIDLKYGVYLLPLYDSLGDFISPRDIKEMIEYEIIELAPLSFMRGRSLKNAFIIMDEAQNSTESEMKMFLTRISEKSKVIITGDCTQSDLNIKKSGLSHCIEKLANIEGISIVQLDSADQQRNPLIGKILDAWDK